MTASTPSSATPPTTLALSATLRLLLALLAAGRSTNSAMWFAQRAGRAWGLTNLKIFAFGRVATVQHIDTDGAARSQSGDIASIDGIDCDHISQLGALVDDIEQGGTTPDAAGTRIDRIEATTRPKWWTVGGGMLLSICVALQVLFSIPAAILAAVAFLTQSIAGWLAGLIGLPRIFTMALQAFASGALGALTVGVGVVGIHEAILAVAVVWMLLIPLPQLVSTVVDAVNAQPHAALTRAVSLVMAVSGVIIGAAIAIHLTRPFSPDVVEVALPTLPLALVLLFSTLGAVGNAFANAGGWDLILPAAIIGIGTAALNQLLSGPLGLTGAWPAALCAVVLGLVASLWAQRTAYSSTALALVGLTGALLPGLTVYQGIAASLAGSGDAMGYFLNAGFVGVALGVGTSFGFVLASTLLRQRDDRSA